MSVQPLLPRVAPKTGRMVTGHDPAGPEAAVPKDHPGCAARLPAGVR
ncbi:hypothetical protein DFR52_102152 [Hoeflea marina]|uniref:Uncharacterized protein n=1 Tax=Hoeflea marina TaxID=274592 RepID=A0A317PPL0_9HYPH|nr:hypothetical protein [Hoeflea marina]PWW01490.1 hypothetical protein DFR52_102152 [Hoeflea marina]